jgi:Helix-turn-helix domain
MTLQTAPDVLGTQEIQAITRLGRDQIKKLVREGTFPNIGNSKRFLVPKTHIVRYLEQGGN